MGRFAGPPRTAIAGQSRDIHVANPAAGKDWSYTFPAGAKYRVALLTFKFAASKQEAERGAAIQIVDGDSNIRWKSAKPGAITKENGPQFSASAGAAGEHPGNGRDAILALPDLLIPAGWTIESAVFSIQTEDQIENVRLLLEEYDDAEPAEPAGLEPRPQLEIDIRS